MKIALLTQTFTPYKKEANILTIRQICKNLNNHTDYCCVIANNARERNGKLRNPKFEIVDNFEVFRPISFTCIKSRYVYHPMNLINSVLPHIIGVNYVQKKKKIKFDIILSVGSNPYLILRSLLAKYFFSGNAKSIHLFKTQSAYKRIPLFFYLCKKLDAIVVQTEKQKKVLLKYGVHPKKIHKIFSPVDTKKFIFLNQKQKLRKRYGYKDENILLYYGHFNKYKGVEYLINSLKYIKTQNIRIILIPSSNDQSNFYLDVIKKVDTKNKIKILDADSDVVKYINLADCVVLPYPSLISTESNPSCILETISCKTPLVTSDLPELREILENKKSAILAKPKDSKDLANKIDILLNNKNLQFRLVSNAYKKLYLFDSNRVSDEYKKLFLELLR